MKSAIFYLPFSRWGLGFQHRLLVAIKIFRVFHTFFSTGCSFKILSAVEPGQRFRFCTSAKFHIIRGGFGSNLSGITIRNYFQTFFLRKSSGIRKRQNWGFFVGWDFPQRPPLIIISFEKSLLKIISFVYCAINVILFPIIENQEI